MSDQLAGVPGSKRRPPSTTHPWLALVGDGEGWAWAWRFKTQEDAERNASEVSQLMGKPFEVGLRP